MTTKEKWKTIQRWAGTPDDGDPGPKTAEAIMTKAGLKLSTDLPKPAEGEPSIASLVKGTGKKIKKIFIHCTATREGQYVDAAIIRKWHKGQGWNDIGYHFVILPDGEVELGRAEHVIGSHVAGFNTGSIGVVYVGGLDAQGRAKDTRTQAQKNAMEDLIRALTKAYPGADVLGHRDASPDLDGDGVIEKHEWLKDCPCFDVRSWWNSVK